ncbi:hypothetical protein TREMEDRAFT_31245 [Tremella mesenterica DSM 1558]|uniref:uncharacterized protein n=1 Tax=Tremella mesenterica (strain ATCC 24925 / CBS 8224 / DSM 1558 / NBRC 9311 / NRRL Y-6157 / RJB 2259-6 / UBC 559-6) TaxID=578456 RepID=UPI0003F49132|nr:uncharacterized protein TREMEDRAFT_31245 [Tremella mesenterica DSM 1558]EIW68889.1 hypothetical protein TREMEDRAFT_31245 [Tremella mesenterica DSM 1558]
MSSLGDEPLSEINFTGGFPENKDFAPSIVFLIAVNKYVLITPLFLYRIFRRQDRTLILIRPGIFLGCRYAMLIIRAILAKGHYSLGLLIAELVLVSIGFLFLIEPLISLWERHVKDSLGDNRPSWVVRLGRLLKIVLIVTIAISAASGALVNQAFKSADGVQKVKTLRETGYILSLVVVGLAIFAIVYTHLHFSLRTQQTGFLLIPACCLLIVAVYRVVQTYQTDPDAASRSTAAFYILQVLFEL